jgi:hypothetical protein
MTCFTTKTNWREKTQNKNTPITNISKKVALNNLHAPVSLHPKQKSYCDIYMPFQGLTLFFFLDVSCGHNTMKNFM